MTTYTITTHRHEADAIARGDKMYIIRKNPMAVGSEIIFRVVDRKEQTPHLIDGRLYTVSYVDSGEPLVDGVTLMGIKRVR